MTLETREILGPCVKLYSAAGFTTGEVEQAIQTASWEAAEAGRIQCRKDFPFAAEWNRKFYATKQVRPIFVEEPTEIVVVTVYTYFF